MRIGCSTISFGATPVDDVLARIGSLGFEVVDVAAVPLFFEHIRLADPPPHQSAHLRERLDALGLEVNAVPTVAWIPDALDDADELGRRLRTAAEVAAAIGAHTWIVDAGKPGPEGDRGTGLERLRATIGLQAEIAADHGLTLAVEAPHAGTLGETWTDALEVIDVAAAAAGTDVAVDVDTSHVHNSGVSWDELGRTLTGRIAHVALRDTGGVGQPRTLGEGDVDFAAALEAVRRAGFEGDVMLELEPSGARSADERTADVARARDFLSPLVSALLR